MAVIDFPHRLHSPEGFNNSTVFRLDVRLNDDSRSEESVESLALDLSNWTDISGSALMMFGFLWLNLEVTSFESIFTYSLVTLLLALDLSISSFKLL